MIPYLRLILLKCPRSSVSSMVLKKLKLDVLALPCRTSTLINLLFFSGGLVSYAVVTFDSNKQIIKNVKSLKSVISNCFTFVKKYA